MSTIDLNEMPAMTPRPDGSPLVRWLRAAVARVSPRPARTPREREAAWIRKALLRRGFTEASNPAEGFAVDASGHGTIVVTCGPDRLGAYLSTLQRAGWRETGIAPGVRALLVTPRRRGW